jgi:chaperonin cofactor prefoldin
MQELEREKDTLQLQVTVLEDQIESQSRRIQEIGEDCLSHSVGDPDPVPFSPRDPG